MNEGSPEKDGLCMTSGLRINGKKKKKSVFVTVNNWKLGNRIQPEEYEKGHVHFIL